MLLYYVISDTCELGVGFKEKYWFDLVWFYGV